jgi:Uma2 family endonuclease
MISSALSLSLQPGETVTLTPLSWERFETILADLGDRRAARIAYFNGNLEIMTPLPEHERSKVILGDLAKTILRLQRRAWEPMGSTTFKRKAMNAGIEPDDCFYIQNYQAVIGKDRIDLSIDPPPDLAIETDVTSKTEISAYAALRVPELWVYANNTFKIYIWQGDRYQDSQTSFIFPTLPIIQLIPDCLQSAKKIGSSQAIANFEQIIQQLIV